MGLVFLVQRARLRHADLWSMQLVFLTIPFVLKTAWPHDFAFFPFTQAFLAWRLMERRKAGVAVTWSLLLASIVLSSILFYSLVGDFTRYGISGFLFLANLLLLIAIYVELLPSALRRPV